MNLEHRKASSSFCLIFSSSVFCLRLFVLISFDEPKCHEKEQMWHQRTAKERQTLQITDTENKLSFQFHCFSFTIFPFFFFWLSFHAPHLFNSIFVEERNIWKEFFVRYFPSFFFLSHVVVMRDTRYSSVPTRTK